MKVISKRYLGDGAYATVDNRTGAIVLTAENGICATDTVVLEPEVLAEFLRFCVDAEAIEPRVVPGAH